MTAERRRLRVTMLVRNSFTHDYRVEKEAASLSAAGYEVTVVADAGPDLPRVERRDHYDVIRAQRPLRAIPFVRFFASGRHLVRILEGTRPDILHAHDSDTLAPVADAARRLRVPFVYDAHELWLHRVRRGRTRAYWAALRAYYAIVERRTIRRAAAVITVSAPIARHLERSYRLEKVHLVPNYPDVDAELAARDLRSLPGGVAIPPDVPLVLFLGGVMPGRGVEGLVRAMPDVPGAHLVLLGQPILRRQIEALALDIDIGDRVHFLGPVPPDEVVAYAASATVGVSPLIPTSLSYAYSLPNKLFQYMAAGLPVVASDFPQVREVVAASDAGLLVDMSQPHLIAGAIRAILEDPDGSARMGRNARAATLRTFNWSHAARELLAVYAELDIHRS